MTAGSFFYNVRTMVILERQRGKNLEALYRAGLRRLIQCNIVVEQLEASREEAGEIIRSTHEMITIFTSVTKYRTILFLTNIAVKKPFSDLQKIFPFWKGSIYILNPT